jgi:D-inositol-3-phosphate glycosyltransferase
MLLFVGRIEPLKGIDTLIDAIAVMNREKVLEDIPFCLIVIGGDAGVDAEKMDAEMNRLRELTKTYGLDNLVRFMGKRSQDTLPYYYSASVAVVVPSQYESFGMVALEAMACGTPVVASQVGGLAFLVQDGITGYTVPSSEPEALAERVKTLIIDPDLRQKLGEQAARFAQDYGWEIIAGRLAQVYEELTIRTPLP